MVCKCKKCKKKLQIPGDLHLKCDCGRVWCSWECAQKYGYSVLVGDRLTVYRNCNVCRIKSNA